MSKRLMTSMLLGALCLQAQAQELPDPTRPPPEARQPAAGELPPAPAAPALPQLQSVLMGTHGREVAVIDGQTVRKGEKFKGAVLVKVSKDRVVLRSGGKDQVLTLFPDAPKDKSRN